MPTRRAQKRAAELRIAFRLDATSTAVKKLEAAPVIKMLHTSVQIMIEHKRAEHSSGNLVISSDTWQKAYSEQVALAAH